MNIQEYIEQKKTIQNYLIIYIDDNNNIEANYENLIRLIEDLKIKEDYQETKLFLYLVSSISNNHYRLPNFFDKIERVLLYFKKEIKEKFSTSNLFKIFNQNKRILLFLIQEEIIIIDQNLFQRINQIHNSSIFYFFPEFKNFLLNPSNISAYDLINKEEFKKFYEKLPEDFEKKRKIGENDSYICELIRNDSIDEFISYVNKECLPLNSQIEQSLYETNPILLRFNFKLIEYAAFFGSVQIFKYLYKNNVDLTQSLWIYGIHSDNPELINILEENKVINDDDYDSNNENLPINYYLINQITFDDCLEEAIKCFHKDIVNYIESNYIKENINQYDNDYLMFIKNNYGSTYYCFEYYNLFHLPLNFEFNDSDFLYACKFDYYTLVKLFLMSKSFNENENII